MVGWYGVALKYMKNFNFVNTDVLLKSNTNKTQCVFAYSFELFKEISVT